MSKKVRLSKEEKRSKKKEKKSNRTPVDETVKITVTRCISALVGTGVICASVSGCVNNITGARIEIAKNKAASLSSNVGVPDNTSGAAVDSTDEPVIVSGPSDASADTPVQEQNVQEETSAGTTENSGSAQKKAAAASPGEMSKGQITELFSKAANSAKSDAKSITQKFCKKTQTTGIELDNKFLAKLADSLISANIGEDETKKDAVYTGKDVIDNFPVSGQTWASKLTEQDVKTASVSESNGVYNVTIRLIDDTQDNLKAGEGHAGKAISLITKEQIVEGAGSAGMAVIKEESIKVRHFNCIIKAQIDKKSGKLINVNYYREWRLSLTALGIDVAVTFGIEEEYKINW